MDLFALECLRVFALSTYEAISQSKELLTGSQSGLSQTQGEKERITGLIQRMVERAPEECRAGTEQTLKLLFPTLDWVFKNTTYGGSTWIRWMRESRVCCGDFFDRYFELELPAEELSNSLLHSLVQQLPDAQQFCDTLRDCDETRQKAILDRLESRINEFPLEQSEAVVMTLLKAGETVSGGESSMTSLSAPTKICHLLLFFLRRHQETSLRSELLSAAFEQVKGFAVLEHLLMLESTTRGKQGIPDLDDVGFEVLKQAFSEALLVHANQDPEAFIAHRNFVAYAYRLNRFADGAGKKWTNQHVTSMKRFLLLARSVVNKGTAYDGEVASNFYFVQIATIKDLFGIEACKGWLAQVDRAALTEPEKQAIQLVEDAVGRHERGEKSDYD